jgi:hypothetical protein
LQDADLLANFLLNWTSTQFSAAVVEGQLRLLTGANLSKLEMELSYMRRTLTLSLLVICLFMSNLVSAEESRLQEVNDNRLRLGVIVPLSGPLAFFGNDFIRAYDLEAISKMGSI